MKAVKAITPKILPLMSLLIPSKLHFFLNRITVARCCLVASSRRSYVLIDRLAMHCWLLLLDPINLILDVLIDACASFSGRRCFIIAKFLVDLTVQRQLQFLGVVLQDTHAEKLNNRYKLI